MFLGQSKRDEMLFHIDNDFLNCVIIRKPIQLLNLFVLRNLLAGGVVFEVLLVV